MLLSLEQHQQQQEHEHSSHWAAITPLMAADCALRARPKRDEIGALSPLCQPGLGYSSITVANSL